MNEIITYVLTLVPSITSIVGGLVTIMVGVSKVKKASHQANDEVRAIAKDNQKIRSEMAEVLASNKELRSENAELRRSQAQLNARLSHMYFVENNGKNVEGDK